MFNIGCKREKFFVSFGKPFQANLRAPADSHLLFRLARRICAYLLRCNLHSIRGGLLFAPSCSLLRYAWLDGASRHKTGSAEFLEFAFSPYKNS